MQVFLTLTQYSSIVGFFSKSKLLQFFFQTFIHFTNNQGARLEMSNMHEKKVKLCDGKLNIIYFF